MMSTRRAPALVMLGTTLALSLTASACGDGAAPPPEFTWRELEASVADFAALDVPEPSPRSAALTASDVGEIVALMKKIKKWLELARDIDACLSSPSPSDCLVTKVVWPGICKLVVARIPLGHLAILGLPLEQICLGEPTLKCCKYTPDQTSCHTAFNTTRPINCEGNPTPGLSPASFGPCLAVDGGPGCLCNYLPACNGPAARGLWAGHDEIPADLAARPLVQAAYLDELSRRLGRSFGAVFDAEPLATAAYVGFYGCRAHRDVFASLPPFAGDDALPAEYRVGEAYTVDDADPDRRYLRAVETLAVWRVFAGLPNLQARWTFIASRKWSEAEVTAQLGAVDADETLRPWVGSVGLAMLRQAEPSRYRLLAVPAPGEPPVPATAASYYAGCEIGRPPVVELAIAVTAGHGVAVTLSIADSFAADEPGRVYPVAITWADGASEVRVVDPADTSSMVVSHTYAAPGSYAIGARVVDGAALVGKASATATVP